jgi:hypothetical protein
MDFPLFIPEPTFINYFLFLIPIRSLLPDQLRIDFFSFEKYLLS